MSGGKQGLDAAGSGVAAAESPSTTSPGRIRRCPRPRRTEPSRDPDLGPCLDPSLDSGCLSVDAWRLLLSTRLWIPVEANKKEFDLVFCCGREVEKKKE